MAERELARPCCHVHRTQSPAEGEKGRRNANYQTLGLGHGDEQSGRLNPTVAKAMVDERGLARRSFAAAH